MPQGLKTKVLDDVLHAEAFGTFDLNNSKVSFQRLLQLARDLGLHKILIDARSVEGDASTTARFELGTYISELHPAGILIAIVARTDTVWPDRFLETVLVNRGVAVKVTTDMAEALDWLKKGNAKNPDIKGTQ